ncbi:hypothetical protein [Colwellia psychrerythraea]|uniref:Uncharacterized protein n=1 Tax=Colwellia psychrerythraea TaxID=28229 RepID=A0A099KMN0_COLPS|nr:hypothetical protein [Colwellia psychrerythraea]KGJ91152.1 hypothetical protein GAB14E_3304 [Colwellia psychrerythraea]
MMKYLSFSILIYAAIAMFLLTLSTVTLAKKRCKPFLEKLHKVQTMQRKGYSLKKGQSLRVKEDKARNKWWQCERSSLASFKAKYGKKKKKAKKKSTKKNLSKSTTKLSKNSKYVLKPQQKITTFNQGSAIVIKSKFQGEKRQAWLQFYQQPIKCQRPKNIKVFAYCSEEKLQQQALFQQGYSG